MLKTRTERIRRAGRECVFTEIYVYGRGATGSRRSKRGWTAVGELHGVIFCMEYQCNYVRMLTHPDAHFLAGVLALGKSSIHLREIHEFERQWSPNRRVPKTEICTAICTKNFGTSWWCTKNIEDMYQNILVHGYFWYVGPRVPKMWYILHRVPKSMPNFWYTMQYVLKNWYTNLYAELNENIIYFGTHRCVYQKILVHAPCVPKILVHIDSFWYILRCFLVCIGICIIFLVHGFGTRIFWYTNWTNRSPKKVEKLKSVWFIQMHWV